MNEEEKQLEEQTETVNKKVGFGQGANQSFGEYQKWLADLRSQTEQAENQNEEQMLSDQRTKSFVSRGFGGDSVLRKMIGLNMMNNGMIDNNLLGYFIYKG